MNPVAEALWFIESHFAEEIALEDIAADAPARPGSKAQF